MAIESIVNRYSPGPERYVQRRLAELLADGLPTLASSSIGITSSPPSLFTPVVDRRPNKLKPLDSSDASRSQARTKRPSLGFGDSDQSDGTPHVDVFA